MADLENLLLEAAGRTNAVKKTRASLASSSKKSSDNRSGSRGKDSEDNDRDDANKEASSQIPFKKRHEQTKPGEEEEEEEEEGCERSDEEESSDDSDVGSDLYKDEDDRKRLAEMTELERELILSDRAAKRDDKSFKEKLKQKLDGKRLKPSVVTPRSSARSADRAAAMGSVLNLLREKQLKQRGLKGGDTLGGTEEKDLSVASFSSSDDDDDDDEVSYGDEEIVESDDEKGVTGSEPPSFEDIMGITIRRSKLVKWFMEPFFEDLIVGCFVRIGIGMSKSGPVYRLCEVQSVDASDPELEYKIEGKSTHKCLVCFWGSESSATKWKMAMVSDSDPTEEEFRQWVREVERSGGRMLSRREVLGKAASIERARTFVYSATTVKQMLEEKKQASLRPVNIAVEKDRLRRKLEAAESESDEAEVERIRARLLELEATRKTREKDAKAVKLAEMNKRNKAENFKNASQRAAVGKKSLRAGDAEYDPFSRRWTRSRNYYDAKAGQRDEAVEEGVGGKDTETASEADFGAGKLVDAGAPMGKNSKPNMLHDFELSISKDVLESFGPQGAQLGYLARKQRIEAMIGCQVLENDGKRHAQTLTVSDYKRRRGLL